MTERRMDPADHGVDLGRLLEEIRPHLDGTQQEIASRAGMTQPYVACLLAGKKLPTLAALAALASASGGKLEVRYRPPRRRRRG